MDLENLLKQLDDAATTGNKLYSEAAEKIRELWDEVTWWKNIKELTARAKYADQLVRWAAVQRCEDPQITYGHLVSSWGDRQQILVDCGKCIPCRARLEINQELEKGE